MTADIPEFRAVCFDLDGTLLPMDIDEFMSEYFKRIGSYAASRGLDGGRFMEALKEGSRAMVLSSEDAVNKDVFWDTFEQVYGTDNLVKEGFGPDARQQVENVASSFYDKEFGHIGDGFSPNPDAARVVSALKAKGYPLVLATMPMFPLRAVEHRLAWAGLDPADFERITNYENSKYTKPRQSYYAENLAAMGLRGEDVLMVGNNTMEDLAFLDLGANAYLVTDWLLDPVDFDLSTIEHGSFAEFADWVDRLPDCKNPASAIHSGVVSKEDTDEAMRLNVSKPIDSQSLEGNAKVLAEAIASDHVPGSAARVKGV